jgi:glyoxylase-like metal-dependent hydrolase (beta-lactamase superfamily II)
VDIVPGVHLVPGVRGSNVYLLADDELVLIDTGLPGNAQRIVTYIKSLGREPEELALIIVTHGHIDHAGSLTELRAMTGARVLAHRDEATATADGSHMLRPNGRSSRGRLVRALARLNARSPSSVDVLVDDGKILPYLGGLRVVATPGHTPGSMGLLLERSGVLFAGDTIINNVDRLSRPLPFGGDRRQSEQSLLKIAELEFDVCCFGHGPPLVGAREKVRELATNHPRSPLYWRMARSWRRLLGFPRRAHWRE